MCYLWWHPPNTHIGCGILEKGEMSGGERRKREGKGKEKEGMEGMGEENDEKMKKTK